MPCVAGSLAAASPRVQPMLLALWVGEFLRADQHLPGLLNPPPPASPTAATAFQRRHNIQCLVCCVLPFLIVVTVVPARSWSFDNGWLLLVSGASEGDSDGGSGGGSGSCSGGNGGGGSGSSGNRRDIDSGDIDGGSGENLRGKVGNAWPGPFLLYAAPTNPPLPHPVHAPAGACSGMAVLVTADVMNVQAADGTKLLGLRWLVLMALSAAVTTLYIELMPRCASVCGWRLAKGRLYAVLGSARQVASTSTPLLPLPPLLSRGVPFLQPDHAAIKRRAERHGPDPGPPRHSPHHLERGHDAVPAVHVASGCDVRAGAREAHLLSSSARPVAAPGWQAVGTPTPPHPSPGPAQVVVGQAGLMVTEILPQPPHTPSRVRPRPHASLLHAVPSPLLLDFRPLPAAPGGLAAACACSTDLPAVGRGTRNFLALPPVPWGGPPCTPPPSHVQPPATSRFLAQLDSVGSVFLINLMQCAVQLAGRLTDRGADDVWRSAVYGIRGSEALNARNVSVQSWLGLEKWLGGRNRRGAARAWNRFFVECTGARPLGVGALAQGLEARPPNALDPKRCPPWRS